MFILYDMYDLYELYDMYELYDLYELYALCIIILIFTDDLTLLACRGLLGRVFSLAGTSPRCWISCWSTGRR